MILKLNQQEDTTIVNIYIYIYMLNIGGPKYINQI